MGVILDSAGADMNYYQNNIGFFSMHKKYPYKSTEQFKRCAELQSKADKAAQNIRYAKNKELAVRTFLQYLYLSI